MRPDKASSSEDDEIIPTEPKSVYTSEHATDSLGRAARLVLLFTAIGLPMAWYLRGWCSGLLLLVGALISASGLWEWKRLMAALMSRMDAQDVVQPPDTSENTQRPSITFAVAGFVVRFVMVLAVLYVNLRYLHGSVLALAAGLAMGVIALTVESVRLLRSGTI